MAADAPSPPLCIEILKNTYRISRPAVYRCDPEADALPSSASLSFKVHDVRTSMHPFTGPVCSEKLVFARRKCTTTWKLAGPSYKTQLVLNFKRMYINIAADLRDHPLGSCADLHGQRYKTETKSP